MQTINVHSFPCESFLSHQNGKSNACWISLGTAGLRSDGFDVLEFPGEVDAEEEEPGGLDHAPAELVGVEGLEESGDRVVGGSGCAARGTSGKHDSGPEKMDVLGFTFCDKIKISIKHVGRRGIF